MPFKVRTQSRNCFALLNPRGTIKAIEESERRCVCTFAKLQQSVILIDNDFKVFRQNLKRLGWKIRPAVKIVKVF
jgi:hypothetical protein